MGTMVERMNEKMGFEMFKELMMRKGKWWIGL